MKKFFVFFLLFSPAFLTTAQTTSFDNQVMLFPISKPAIIKFKGTQKELKLSWICNESGEIEIVKGKICLVTIKGKELTFNSGARIKITKVDPNNNFFPLDKTSKYINKPSVYFPSLYSDKRTDILVFPTQSMVAKLENLKFYYNDEERIEDAVFKLYSKETKKLVWKSDNFSNEFMSKNIPLTIGKEYYWKIYNKSNSAKGTFQLLTKAQLKKIKLPKKMKMKEDYINSLFIFLEHNCFFDAAAILQEANEKFPDSELFKTLRAKIPASSTP